MKKQYSHSTLARWSQLLITMAGCGLTAAFVAGCNDKLPEVHQGRGIGVIVADTDTRLAALEAGMDLANRNGLLPEGQLYLEVRSLSEFGSADEIFASFIDDGNIFAVISLLEGEQSSDMPGLAETYQLLVVSPLGTEWWENAQESENPWHLGLIASTPGMVAALGTLVDDASITCTSLGVILGGESEQRVEDVAKIEQLAARHALAWGGAVHPTGAAPAETWANTPDCIVAERGTHAFAAKLAEDLESQFIFANAIGVEEFRDAPELIEALNGNYALTSSNGPQERSITNYFEDYYQRVSPDGELPLWFEANFIDALMPMAIATVVTIERDLYPLIYRVVATQDASGQAGMDVFTPLPGLHNLFISAVAAVERDLSGDVFVGPGPAYSGASGSIDFVPGRPIPKQAYVLRRVVDYVEGTFETVGRLNTLRGSTEYE